MFLLPSTSPKLRTLTTYAASAMGAKLSFAFTRLTYNGVNRQFSTHLIQPVDPSSPPSEEHLSRITLRMAFIFSVSSRGTRCFMGITSSHASHRILLLYSSILFIKCPFGGGGGNRTPVQLCVQSASTNCALFIPHWS